MKHGHSETDEREKTGPLTVAETGGVLRDRWIGRQPGVDANEDRCPERTKADGGALNDHPGHDRGHPRKAQADQKRHGHGRRGAKTGRTFDKGPKEPRDDDHLHPPVGRDVGEPLADCLDRTALLERVQQKDGAKDDVEQRQGDDQAVDRCGHDLERRHPPHRQRQHDRDGIGERHRPARRPPQTNEEDGDSHDRQQGQ